MTSTASRVTAVLENVTGTDQVSRDPNIALFDLDLLDSLGMVELMVALSEEFGVSISPAEIEREQWSTPQKIVTYMENRIGA
jgi:D-alanine--poly(phosphoribitol) ligase subunit 2